MAHVGCGILNSPSFTRDSLGGGIFKLDRTLPTTAVLGPSHYLNFTLFWCSFTSPSSPGGLPIRFYINFVLKPWPQILPLTSHLSGVCDPVAGQEAV